MITLSASLGDKPYRDGDRFTARPAFRRAVDAQIGHFRKAA